MINSREGGNEEMSNNKYSIPYYVGECLENKNNSEELIKVFGYFIDKTGVVVYVNRDIYSSNIEDCEIIKLEELNTNWKKTLKITITNIPGNRINIGLSKMIDEKYGHFEVADKGVALVRKSKTR